jgi:hypothetical protein
VYAQEFAKRMNGRTFQEMNVFTLIHVVSWIGCQSIHVVTLQMHGHLHQQI